MTKKKDEYRPRDLAVAGGGAVAAGTGLAAGGVPGGKSDFTSVFRVDAQRQAVKQSGKKGPRRALANVRAVAPAAKAAPGGILGFRVHAHKGGTVGFEQAAAEHAKSQPKDAVDAFYRAHNAGKIAPEKEILRGMSRGKVAANALLVGGAGATAYGLSRDKTKYHPKKRVAKRDDRSDKYNAALLGTGGTVAVGSHKAGKFLGKQGKKYERRAIKNVDEAGKLIPGIAGRQGKKLSERQMRSFQRKHGFEGKSFTETPWPKTMYPKVKDGDIGRNPGLLAGASQEAIDRAGKMRGAAAQERHFAEVFNNTSKVVRRGRAPGAIVAATGAGGLAVQHDWKKSKVHKADRLMSDAEIKRRKKIQGKISRTTSTLGLTGVAIGGTALLASKKPGALKNIPGLRKANPEKLKEAGLYTSLASGGVGGVGGYNFAAYTNAESRRRTPTMVQPQKKKIKKSNESAFGVAHD